MKKLGNLLWHFPLFGFVTALLTFLTGGIFVITVIGAPIGLGLIQHSKFLLTPFSSRMISDSKLKKDKTPFWKILSVIAFILYLPIGIFTSIITIIQIILLFISIIGIPIAVILSKSLSTYFNPINKICVSTSVAKEIEKRAASGKVDAMMN
jgi:uncharacterized membrane protein YccF (DUF307 family)|tara:strand:- start:1158 stop:1613 length:456 start_codon:yes stop_codon:yes gene_type:complete